MIHLMVQAYMLELDLDLDNNWSTIRGKVAMCSRVWHHRRPIPSAPMPQFNPLEFPGNIFLHKHNLNPDRYHSANPLPHPCLVPSSIATVTVSRNSLPGGGVRVVPTIIAS